MENSLVRKCSKPEFLVREEEYPTINLEQSIVKVLKIQLSPPKAFLITIGDRTVGGCTSRDQMVGPMANSCS